MRRITRRSFLARSVVATGAGVLAVPIVAGAHAASAAAPPSRLSNAYLLIAADGSIVATLPTAEMGQGTHTAQAAILAEELGVSLASIRITMPSQPADPYRVRFGSLARMRSVGSFGIRFWHDPLRRAAAQARAVLLQAGAGRLGVPPDQLDTDDAHVVHAGTGRRLPFAELVADAAALPLPADPPLRPAAERRLTGRTIPRVDTPAKVDGSAAFGVDVRLPGMLFGAVSLAPIWRAERVRHDAAAVARMPGVVAVVDVPRGVVVVARTWWEAKRAADALPIEFAATAYDTWSTAAMRAQYRSGLDAPPGAPLLLRGDPAAAFAGAGRVHEAGYEVPFLAHVCMEPIACAARVAKDRAELWISTQDPDVVTDAVGAETGLPASRIFVHTPYLGGGFGRKAFGDVAVQAVRASRAAGGRPVLVQWSREDDVRQGHYRPAMAARFRAVLDASGRIAALDVKLAGPQMGREFLHVRPNIRNGLDPFSVSSLVAHKYAIAHQRIEHHVVEVPVPLSPWRSVSSSQNGFWLEAFVDELAYEARQDPLAFRRAHLAGQVRHLAVLDRLATLSNWATPAAAGVHRGLAIYESYGSVVGEVVELRMDDGRPRVTTVYVAIDCGRAINPGQVVAQMEGSVIDALGAAWRQAITVSNGRAEQSNFADYPLLRIGEVPRVEVAIVDTGAPIGGVGEPGVPPLAAALVNALRAATGRPVRSLPLGSALA